MAQVSPAADQPPAIAHLDVATLEPETFWAQHIATRQPALIRGHPTDLAWRATGLWTDDYLCKRAGNATVLVEVRGGPAEAYGRGLKRAMKFGAFVRSVAAGNTTNYLSAQQVAVSRDGHPELIAEPLSSLAGGAVAGGSCGAVRASSGVMDFPASPRLAGHLVPQSVNMWMGAAPEGSSSGLHHDFHDNIYVLLRGRKRFRLYPPSAAPSMYTVGRLAQVHPNGRIVYEGQGDVQADGTSAATVRLWRRRTEAEAEVAAAQAAVERGEQDAASRLAAAEEALEEVLDAALEAGLQGGDGFDDLDGLDEEEGEEEEEEGEAEEGGEEAEEEEDNDDSDMADAVTVNGSAGRTTEQHPQQTAATTMTAATMTPMDPEGGGVWEARRDLLEEFDQAGVRTAPTPHRSQRGRGRLGDGDGRGGEAEEEAGPLIVDNDTPPSFSRVPLGDPAVSDAELAAAFPDFPGRGAAVEVVVEAGDMLYLPAGWFHEVTSYSSTGGCPDGCHLALNFWFQPPDNLDPSRRGFRMPYTSDYWPSLWRARVAAGLPGGMEPGLGAQPPPGEAEAGGGGGGEGQEQADGEEAEVGVEVDGESRLDSGGHQKEGGGGAGAHRSGKRRLGSSNGGDHVENWVGGGDWEGAGAGGQRKRVRGEGDMAGAVRRSRRGSGREVDQQEVEEGEEDLDPPRRPSGVSKRSVACEVLAALSGGGEEQQMSEQDYQLLLTMDAARRRRTAMAALQSFMARYERRQRLMRLRAAVPPGRRHHLPVYVSAEVRAWRPAGPQQGAAKGQKGESFKG